MRPELISCKDGDPQLLEYEMLSPYMLSNGGRGLGAPESNVGQELRSNRRLTERLQGDFRQLDCPLKNKVTVNMNQNNSCRIQELKQLVEYGTGSARPNVAGHSQWQSRRPYRWCNWYRTFCGGAIPCQVFCQQLQRLNDSVKNHYTASDAKVVFGDVADEPARVTTKAFCSLCQLG